MLLQEEAVCQESYASVIAEEEWSNVCFNVSKADERHGEEKGEQEIRGEKESREVPKARGRPPKVSSVWYSIACSPQYYKVSSHWPLPITVHRQAMQCSKV